jgi:outer membrane protein TolC
MDPTNHPLARRPHAVSSRIALLSALALAGMLALAPPRLVAASPPGADVGSIRTWLLEHNPELRAMQAEAEAAGARVNPAGALPDPRAAIELRDIDPDRPNLSPAAVGSTTYSLKQAIPLWGKRALARDMAREQARAARFDREAVALDLLNQAEQAYVRYWHAREAVAVIDRRIALLDQLEAVARTRYAVGMAAQQDSIQAQVAGTSLQRERIDRLAIREQAAAALNSILGRSPDAMLAEPDVEPVLPLPAASLAAALAALSSRRHPAQRASAALAAAADSAARLQRRQRLPDLTVGVGIMQRADRVAGYEVMLEVEIPLQQRARRERERAALRMGDAARAREQAVATAIQGQLGQTWARVRSARDQRRLIERTLLVQAQANFESALASYRVGEVDFGTLIQALQSWQGADLARIDARRDELIGASAVRALLGSGQ